MPAQDAPTTPRGSVSTGTGYLSTWGGAFDSLEHVGDLTWPLSIRTYAKMRHDPVLTSVLGAYSLPIRKTSWHVDPRGAPARITKLCADSLGLPILGRDPKPGPARRRGVRWLEHLDVALDALVFGHSVFEPVYDLSIGAAMLASLAERPQLSFAEIQVDDQGALKSATQYGDVTKPNPPSIPGDRLLWYCVGRRGANWAGQSLIRHAFGPWLLKQEALRVNATGERRFAVGIPTVEWESGSNPTSAQRAEALTMVRSIRGGDTSGVVLPPGARLVVQGVQGTFPDVLKSIRYYDEQMARGALASMLDLGSTSNGSRALGDSFADLMHLGQQAIADRIAETATEVCVRLTDYNAGEDTPSPAVVPGDLTVDEETLAQSVAALIQQGAITPDDDTEAWLRDVYGAPAKRAEPNPAPTPAAEPPTPTPVTARRRPRPVTAATAPPERRDLTAEEQAAGLDPAAVDTAHDEVLAALLLAWAAIQDEQQDSLTAQVAAATTLAALAVLALDTGDAADVLGAAMLEAYDRGAALALAEIQHQGYTLPLPEADVAAIEDRAAALTTVMGQQTASAAAREALRLAGDGTDPADIAAGVRTHLEGLSSAWVEDQLGAAVADGIGDGRAAVFAAVEAAAPQGVRFFASEIRDAGTCTSKKDPAPGGVKRCLEIDGTEYASLAAAREDYPSGQYKHCAGRLRCRGMIFLTFDGQSLDDARSGPVPEAELISLEVFA